MAATAYVHTRIDPRTKKNAEQVLNGIGMSVSEAVRLFLTSVSTTKTFPIELTGRAATDAAIEDARKGRNMTRVKSIDAMFKDARK